MEPAFFDDISRAIRGRRRRDAILRELESHLDASRHDLLHAGYTLDEAQRESLLRLGDPVCIAADFHEVYRPARRSQIGVAFALAGALVLGMLTLGGSLASATTTHHMHSPSHDRVEHTAPPTSHRKS